MLDFLTNPPLLNKVAPTGLMKVGGFHLRNNSFRKFPVLNKIVAKTKICRIRSQQIRESCGIQTINGMGGKEKKRMGRTYKTRLDAEGLVKISRDLFVFDLIGVVITALSTATLQHLLCSPEFRYY